MKIVVFLSANAEWKAVKEIFPDLEIQVSPLGEFANLIPNALHLILFHGGWGEISAAATAQYGLIISNQIYWSISEHAADLKAASNAGKLF